MSTSHAIVEFMSMDVEVSTAARGVVEKTVERFDRLLRGHLAHATALDAPKKGQGNVITVKVDDGMPDELASKTDGTEGWQWWLVMHGPELTATSSGLAIVIKEKERLAGSEIIKPSSIQSLKESKELIDAILSRSAAEDIKARLKEIEDDILGAYWVERAAVSVYWMPCAVFAAIYNLELAHVATITLCHELAHAYTHVGVDRNGNAWKTDDFMDTDTRIKEGLAQYYTEEVLREHIEKALPGVTDAFIRLRGGQSDMYSDYVNWVEKPNARTVEAVRHTMLRTRVGPKPPTYATFKRRVVKAHELLSGNLRQDKAPEQGSLL